MLTKEQQERLLGLARESLVAAANGQPAPDPAIADEALTRNCGAFVTLHKRGELRGCIGLIEAVKPLYRSVIEMARSAALNDPRFPPVSPSEVDEIDVEISVLSPLRKIERVEEIQVGRHGLLVRKGYQSGLLLPQVATEYGWDRQTFLEHTCQKALLPRDAWKQGADIYTFEAFVFGEKRREAEGDPI
ncbi:MAG: AmmeMemoRadiSam system protein A [Armatimonadota bacterium]